MEGQTQQLKMLYTKDDLFVMLGDKAQPLIDNLITWAVPHHYTDIGDLFFLHDELNRWFNHKP